MQFNFIQPPLSQAAPLVMYFTIKMSCKQKWNIPVIVERSCFFGSDGAHVTELICLHSCCSLNPRTTENRTGWHSSWGRNKRFRRRNTWAGTRHDGRLWAFGRRALLLLSAQLHLGEFIWAGKSVTLRDTSSYLPCDSVIELYSDFQRSCVAFLKVILEARFGSVRVAL